MRELLVKETIAELEPWYQTVEIDGVLTRQGRCVSGICTWEKLKTLLPANMDGMRVLDLGCNAGFHSVQAALLGAEVLGVEWDDLACRQACFVREYFKSLYQKEFRVDYIKEDVEGLDYSSMGKFDYIFALAVLYHIGPGMVGITPRPKKSPEALERQWKLVEKLTLAGDYVIVRARRGPHALTAYNRMFSSFGFEVVKNISEKARGFGLYGRRA